MRSQTLQIRVRSSPLVISLGLIARVRSRLNRLFPSGIGALFSRLPIRSPAFWLTALKPHLAILVLALTLPLHAIAAGVEGFPDQEFTRNVPIPEFQNRGEATPYNRDAPPKGIFYKISFAEDFEQEVGLRRTHEIVPVNPTTVFKPDTPVVYIVFALHQHYDSFQLIGLCFPEQVDGLDGQTLLAQDRVYVALEDDSGYIQLAAPEGGWKLGNYKVEIHLGWGVSGISLIGTMRFTVESS